MDVLRDLATRLVIPGLPEWTGLVALLLLLLAGLAFALMPFAVFGVKGRLEAIEAQLDELRTELRTVGLRMGEAPPRRVVAEDWADAPTLRRGEVAAPRVAPPVPPPAAWPEKRGRAEPRVELPR